MQALRDLPESQQAFGWTDDEKYMHAAREIVSFERNERLVQPGHDSDGDGDGESHDTGGADAKNLSRWWVTRQPAMQPDMRATPWGAGSLQTDAAQAVCCD